MLLTNEAYIFVVLPRDNWWRNVANCHILNGKTR
jgi:hypothetical protein